MGIQWPQNQYYGVTPYNPQMTPGAAQAAPFVQSYPLQGAYANPYPQSPVQVSSTMSPEGNPIHFYTLGNGHRIVIEQRPTDIISLRTFINAGSINENPMDPSPLYGRTGFPPGIAHLDEHCHFLSTRNFPQKNSWAAQVEKVGARLNASTDSEVIQHELTFNREDLAYMLAMHGESVMRPVYKTADITQEKHNVINEMGERTNTPENKVFYKLSHLMFDRSELQTLGRPSDVMGTTAEQLQRFHQTFYTPTNMVTVISGRVDPNMVVSALNRDFGNNPPRISADYSVANKLALRPGQIRSATIYDPQLNYSMVNLGFGAPNKANYKDRMAMEIIADLLGGGPMSLLEKQVKDQQRLASQIGVSYRPMKGAGVFNVFLHTNPGEEQKALKATLSGVSQLSRWQVTPEKLAESRDRITHAFKQGLNNVEMSTQAMGEESLTNTLPYYLNYVQLANSITPQDILQAAQKYLNPRTYAVVFGVPGKNPPTNSHMEGA